MANFWPCREGRVAGRRAGSMGRLCHVAAQTKGRNMNRIRLLFAFSTILVAMAIAPLAQASMGTLELNAGYAKSSDKEEGIDESLSGGISFGGAFWRNVSPMFTLGLEVSYDDLGKIEYDNGLTANNEVKFHLLRVNPALRVNFGQSTGAAFFAQGGAGLYNVTGKIEDSEFGSFSNTDGEFGFNIGAGAGFPMGEKARLNFTGVYHSVAVEDDNLTYLQFKAGIGFGI
jgi:hypothetical protein